MICNDLGQFSWPCSQAKKNMAAFTALFAIFQSSYIADGRMSGNAATRLLLRFMPGRCDAACLFHCWTLKPSLVC